MANRAANVASIDALRTCKAAIQQFMAEVTDAVMLFDLECRRPIDWIENDRPRYWPRALQKASDAVGEARIALERCELTSNADEHRSCYDEKKALEKAKRRLHLCEEKIQIVQRWRSKVRKEVEEFQTQLAKLQNFVDTDVLRATAVLERMAQALDKYVQQSGPSETQPTTGANE